MPLCVFNNRKGADARTLAAYREREWNNPVVRIVDVLKKDVVRRNGAGWTVTAVAQQLVDALAHRKRPVPRYLQTLLEENGARGRGIETAVFGMT